MNKTLKVLSALFLISLLLVGCIDDDRSDCPKLKLTFRYTADSDTNVIADYLESARLYVFSEDGRFVTSLTVSKQELVSPDGMFIDLKPGNYTLACWGNAHVRTEIIQTDWAHSTVRSNDQLYYSTSSFVVTEENTVKQTLTFCSAHINFHIYVKGGSGMPVVSLHNLIPQYDFGMNPLGDPVAIHTSAITFDGDKQIYVADFQTLRFTDDNPIEIQIRNSEGSLLCRERLADFMARQSPPLTVNGKQEVTIHMMFEITSLGVNITVPDWTIENVTPTPKIY